MPKHFSGLYHARRYTSALIYLLPLRVTNYNVTIDIINTVKLTKPVLSTFKMLLIIH